MRALRTLRILRPLKAMRTVPSLRKQINALIDSVKGLINVLVFLCFIFMIFSIVGLQWFKGYSYYTCRVSELPIEGDTVWEKYTDDRGDYSGVCTPEENQFFGFIDYSTCP